MSTVSHSLDSEQPALVNIDDDDELREELEAQLQKRRKTDVSASAANVNTSVPPCPHDCITRVVFPFARLLFLLLKEFASFSDKCILEFDSDTGLEVLYHDAISSSQVKLEIPKSSFSLYKLPSSQSLNDRLFCIKYSDVKILLKYAKVKSIVSIEKRTDTPDKIAFVFHTGNDINQIITNTLTINTSDPIIQFPVNDDKNYAVTSSINYSVFANYINTAHSTSVGTSAISLHVAKETQRMKLYIVPSLKSGQGKSITSEFDCQVVKHVQQTPSDMYFSIGSLRVFTSFIFAAKTITVSLGKVPDVPMKITIDFINPSNISQNLGKITAYLATKITF